MIIKHNCFCALALIALVLSSTQATDDNDDDDVDTLSSNNIFRANKQRLVAKLLAKQSLNLQKRLASRASPAAQQPREPSELAEFMRDPNDDLSYVEQEHTLISLAEALSDSESERNQLREALRQALDAQQRKQEAEQRQAKQNRAQKFFGLMGKIAGNTAKSLASVAAVALMISACGDALISLIFSTHIA